MVGAWSWGKKIREYLFNGYRVSFFQNDKFLEIECTIT